MIDGLEFGDSAIAALVNLWFWDHTCDFDRDSKFGSVQVTRKSERNIGTAAPDGPTVP
jgi:hypothetical protein